MKDRKSDMPQSLTIAISRFDRAFSQGRLDELVSLFAQDARLMWPDTEDIIGRDAIRSALEEFMAENTTLRFLPDRQVVEVCGSKTFTIGRFIEDLAPTSGDRARRVYGRIVEMWTQTANGDWEIAILLTGRYAETEVLPKESAQA